MTYKEFVIRLKGYAGRKLRKLNLYKFLAHKYIDNLNKKEFKNPPFSFFNERPVEYRFVFEQISMLYPKKILDIGTGVTALPHLMANCGCAVTAIDNIKDYWMEGMFNRHFYVINDDIVQTKIDGSFDMITCISTLEHIEKYDQAVKNMFDLLKSGGHLILTFPYSENKFVNNVYALLESSAYGKKISFKTHSYSREKIDGWIKNNNAKIIKQEYWQFFTGKFWTTGDKLKLPREVEKNDLHQISCILFQKQ